LALLYVGDWDPSGMNMSEVDLLKRFERYEGDHVDLTRIALTENDLADLPGFPASDKAADSRYRWFVANYGDECWELDAMNPNDLRDRVEEEIKERIEPIAWARCDHINKAEQESLKTILSNWKTPDAVDE
jgi:hypothetical protein